MTESSGPYRSSTQHRTASLDLESLTPFNRLSKASISPDTPRPKGKSGVCLCYSKHWRTYIMLLLCTLSVYLLDAA